MNTGVLSKKDGMMVVAAIDFGTTYSGYAFSTKEQYDKDKTKINMNQTWSSLISAKAPTSVLFNEKKKFHSFGYDAEEKYATLASDKKNKDVFKTWYFFRRFKMMLHDRKIHREMVIEDETMKPMPAIDVFGAVILYLKEKLLEQMRKTASHFENRDIHWVLTVPAIWSESAKQFMREAASQAGIDGELLSIALEPEVASIFTQISHKDITVKSDGTKHILSVPGVKYMVIDLGGGTVDITVHKREADDDRLTEVHKATGGAWGGTKVDEDFLQMLIRIVGAPVLTKFKDEHMDDYFRLQQNLEVKKRNITHDMEEDVTLTVPSKLARTYEMENQEPVQAAIDQSPKYSGMVTWEDDKLRMHPSIFKDFFRACKSKLVNHIKELMQKPDVKDTKVFLMVGGFSESAIMQDAVKKAFPHVEVIIPTDAGLSVLKGAVIFGHAPLINSRVARYTYGINISPPFDPSCHKADHKVTVGGIERCRDWFKPYIKEGEVVQVNEPRMGKHISLQAGQREMVLNVVASEVKEVSYTDEDFVTPLGKVIVLLPHSDDKIKVEVTMMFGKTELQVSAQEMQTHKIYKAYFDFL